MQNPGSFVNEQWMHASKIMSIIKEKEVLFISHDASRTGAPIVLLSLLKAFQDKGIRSTVFLKNGGDLEEEFKTTAFSYTPPIRYSSISKLKSRVLRKVLGRKYISPDRLIPQSLKRRSFDLVYINTIDAIHFAPEFKKLYNCPVICHVHENQFSLSYYFEERMSVDNLAAVDCFIAVSESTRNNLIERYKIPSSKIELVYEFVPVNELRKPSAEKSAIKAGLKLSDEFIVGGCGVSSWRKGIDYFVQLAFVINRLRPNHAIKLIWVGELSEEFKKQYEYECERLEIGKTLLFTGKVADPHNYFQIFDVFALTSREDPFPLVVLEAAAQSKLILCFDQSGGIPELVGNGQGGFIVPYGDVRKMAELIIELCDNRFLVAQKGEEASEMVKDFDVALAADRIERIIESKIK